MNMVLLFEDDFIAGTCRVRLKGRRLRHVIEVHRASVGERLCVGQAGGAIGTGIITRLDSSILEMEVLLDRTPPAPLPATLLVALPRPKVLKRVLLTATTLGVKRIVLLNAFRVEKSFWKSPALEQESIAKQLVLGLEQSRDTVFPEVLLRPRFKPFVEDELPDLVHGTLPFVAHPGSPRPCPHSVGHPVTVAVGPEGGFIPYEMERLTACGFTAVDLGERILRVETAVPFLLSKLF